jgi:signal transduction histidine kinase
MLSESVLFSTAKLVYHHPYIHQILFFLKNVFGIQMIDSLIFVFLFIIYFMLLTKKSISYIEKMAGAINSIEKGNLDVKINIKSDDELGDLAASINSMTSKLKKSIEDERHAEQAKNELITNVSHDLRTPLTSVIGFLGLLIDRENRSEEELQRYTEIAHKKAISLQSLIDELFEFTRMSYGGISIKKTKINLGELLEQLTDEFYPVLNDAGMECRISVPDDKVYIMADGDLLVRLFENLINNSIRYGKDGKYIDVVLKRQDKNVFVDVINYGNRISDSDIPYIFEQFYRADKSRTSFNGGTGLGLAIVKRIAELHNGTVKVESSEKQTCFEVNLLISDDSEKNQPIC